MSTIDIKNEKKNNESKVKSAALILHDIGTKDERKEKVENFKEGKIVDEELQKQHLELVKAFKKAI